MPQIIFIGPGKRYGYGSLIFERGVGQEVDAEAREYLLSTRRFSDVLEDKGDTPKKGGVTIRKSKTPDVEVTVSAGAFKTKDEALAYAKNAHGVDLDPNAALKRLNAATLELQKRAEAGASFAGVDTLVTPVGTGVVSAQNAEAGDTEAGGTEVAVEV